MLLEAQRLLSALQDAETGQRGYVITARPGYLEPYEAGRREVAADLDHLAETIWNNPRAQARITELRRVIAAKLTELAEPVALVRAGNLPGAIAIVMTERGKILMDQARATIGAIIAEEQRQKAIDNAAAEKAFARERRLTYALAAVGLLTLLGAALAAMWAVRAITQAQSSAEFIASEERIRLFVERAPTAIAMFDNDMRYLLANRRYLRDYVLDEIAARGALINHSHYEVFPEISQRWREIHRRVLRGETLSAQDEEFPRGDGSSDWMRWEMTPWHQADGSIGGAILFSEVVTAHKRMEIRQALLLELASRLTAAPHEAMDAAAALLRSHLSVTEVGCGEIDEMADQKTTGHEFSDGKVAATVGPRHLTILGSEIIEDLRAGRTVVVTDVVADRRTREKSAAYQAMDARSLVAVPFVRQERLQALLYVAHRDPRAWTTAEVEVVGEVAARTWAAVEQASMKEALRRIAEEFLTLAEGLPVLCWMAEPDGHVYWYNQRWYDYTGTTPPEMEGWGWQSVHDPDALPGVLEQWRASLATGAPFEMTYLLRGAHGVFRMFLTRVAPVHDADGHVRRWLGTNVDVAEAAGREATLERSAAALRDSEARLLQAHDELERRVIEEVRAREAAQAKLAQAEKLSALGQLAGGIAHDFNNVMQAISGGASLIERHADSATTVKRLAKIVEDAASRGASITRRLLTFARRGELRAGPVDVSALLLGLREILAYTLGAAVRIELDVAEGLPAVLADRGQLETVLVNLATNARDAMPQGGTITMTANSERISGNEHPEGLAPGAYVRFTVADTGTGIDAATLARVMEPFFTTKEQGKGTGLGLPMARGFAQQSGGALTIASDPGRGTVVALWLPLTGAKIALPACSEPATVTVGSVKPRLLLVDDEELVREVVAEQLIDRGYDVIEAEGGDRALALLDAGCHVDLIIADLSMPGMDGVSLIRAVQMRKQLPAILLTGYAGEASALAVGKEFSGSFSLLRKPVTGDHLADRVATLLEAATMREGSEAAVTFGS